MGDAAGYKATANRFDLGGRQLGAAVFLATRTGIGMTMVAISVSRSQSPFLLGVNGIVRSGSEEEVGGINTVSDIAMMQDTNSVSSGNRPHKPLVGKPMGQHIMLSAFIGVTQLTVAAAIATGPPVPAGGGFFHLRPEAIISERHLLNCSTVGREFPT